MNSQLQRILSQITQYGAAGQIAAQHDAARLSLGQQPLRVRDNAHFMEVLGRVVNLQLEKTGRGALPAYEAQREAVEILESGGRRSGKSYANFARDAMDGRNGGLRVAIDLVADGLRDKQTQRFVAASIDAAVDPLNWDQKVAITRQILSHYQQISPQSISESRAEPHAHDYQSLIREISQHVDSMSNTMRSH